MARQTRSLEVTVASQRRRQILDAARAVIDEEGIEQTTLRKVAERAGVSHGTIAYYFQSRKQLIDASLLETSRAFMAELYSRKQSYGPAVLAQLVETFLDPKNRTASFVVQMIDAGLHDIELRGVHNEFVEYGCDLIEQSIRAGMATGDYRNDIDAALAARLIHSVLVWWGSELAGDATSREVAATVGRLAISLLRPPAGERGRTRLHAVDDRHNEGAPALESVRAALLADPRLSEEAASGLTEAFAKMYALVARDE
jgi:AcrR family transcriptional regulator